MTVTLYGVEVCREHGRRWGVVGCRACPHAWHVESDVEVDVRTNGEDCDVADVGRVVATGQRYSLNDRERNDAAELARETFARERPQHFIEQHGARFYAPFPAG